MTGYLSRRGLLRRGAAAAAVVAGAGAVAGCAQSAGGAVGSGSTAAPTTQQTKIVLGMRAWGVGSGAAGSPKTIDALLYEKTKPWRDLHPGVDINIIENSGGPAAVIASIIAGSGPDIYHSWHPAEMFATEDYTADLGPYMKQYNVDISVYNKAQMDLFVQPNGVRALPYYLGTMALAVNEGLLDQLGLQYPAPDWTYQDYAALATSIAREGKAGTGAVKKPVYGADYGLGNLGAPSGYLPPDCILQGFGGSYVDPNDTTKSNLGSENVINAVTWVYDLAKNKVLAGPGAPGVSFTGSTLGMTWAPSFFLPAAATGWKGLKWKYYNMPSFPATGAVTGGTEDLWAMNPHSKHLDLAWDLLHWCSFEPAWQISQMEIFLLSPALVGLWDQWLTFVPQIAPPLANKNLTAFATLAKSNKAYPQQFTRYSSTSAYTLIDSWGQKMYTNKVDIRGGLTQLAQQIDQLELVSSSEAQAAVGVAKAFPSTGPAIAAVTPGL